MAVQGGEIDLDLIRSNTTGFEDDLDNHDRLRANSLPYRASHGRV